MTDLDDIFERLRQNEATDEKFFEVEKRILSTLNFRDLFNVLLTEIEAIFDLPAVWLTLIEECDAARLIPLLESEAGLASRLCQIRRRHFADLLGDDHGPILADRDPERFAPLFPEGAPWEVASLAVVPISIDGEVIGSLNLGDPDPHRFSPDLDTGLLRRLGVKVSLCLSNVTAHEKLSFLAYHDALTGLLNRRVMASVLAREVERSERYGHPLSVVFIDVDDFKAVNDTYGHELGDALLRHLAGILSDSCRTSDVVARFAGDEFVVILPDGSAASARNLMQRVCRSASQKPLQTPAARVAVNISFGIASLEPGKGQSPETLLQRADQELYRVKRSKKPQTERRADRVIAFSAVEEPQEKEKP